jgi:hypothetical protein
MTSLSPDADDVTALMAEAIELVTYSVRVFPSMLR